MTAKKMLQTPEDPMPDDCQVGEHGSSPDVVRVTFDPTYTSSPPSFLAIPGPSLPLSPPQSGPISRSTTPTRLLSDGNSESGGEDAPVKFTCLLCSGELQGNENISDPDDTGSTKDDEKEETRGSEARKVEEELTNLIGLDAIKKNFEGLEKYVKYSKLTGVDIQQERFHAVFQGNPGTGKTTVARLYARLLYALGIQPSKKFVETTGGKLASQGPAGVMKIFDDDSDESNGNEFAAMMRMMRPQRNQNSSAKNSRGGVLFVDEAYQLISPHASNAGKQVLDIILTEMENSSTRWVVIFAGYKNDLEAFFAHNDGLRSRIPSVMDFQDFSETQLHSIFLGLIERRYNGRCKIDGGPRGQYMQAAMRRLSSGREKRGFGNARSVENLLSKICQRQAQRLLQIKDREPSEEELLFFSREDLIGPSPANIKSSSEAWAKLQTLIGLQQIKTSVDAMLCMIEENYHRELRGLKPFTVSLNRVFVGSPGTGKTTVAELYGKILADMGLLSNGDVVLKNPSDFIGDAVGKSESNTKAILASTVGKVLVIDEAYMLDPGDATHGRNTYKTAVLDLLVTEIQGNPGEDRCVILLGYEDKMQSLFRNGNSGLAGRFMAKAPFRFSDYTMAELREIMQLDLEARDVCCAEEAIDAAMGVLSRAKNSPNFSNAREVRTLVSAAILNYQARQMQMPPNAQRFSGVLYSEDFDPRLGPSAISSKSPLTCRDALCHRVSDAVIKQLERYLPTEWILGSRNRDLLRVVPKTFVFKGPPGTGKSTVAKQLGPLFYDMGILLSPDVIERNAADFIGQHVGHTIPKTRDLLRGGIGKVLVIDDVHRLTKGGYTTEAVDELVSFVRRYSTQMVVVLTGHAKAVDELMTERPDLDARFPGEIVFGNLTPDECLTLLTRLLELEGVKSPFFASEDAKKQFKKAFGLLSAFQCWNNAIDVSLLARGMLYKAYEKDPPDGFLYIDEQSAMGCIKDMFQKKNNRAKKAGAAEVRAKNSAAEADNQAGNAEEGNNIPASSQAVQESRPEREDKVQSENTIAREDWRRKKDKSRTVAEILKEMAPCENGFDWIREGNGYRCRGGDHKISDAEIESQM